VVSAFVHLRAYTAYSLLQGAIKVPQLVALAKEQHMPALAITDHDNLFGSLEFSEACLREGIQPIIGYHASLVPHDVAQEGGRHHGKIIPETLMLYAKDSQGYDNLLALASAAYTDPALERSPLLSYEQVARHADGLMALTGGLQGGIGQALLHERKDQARALTQMLHEAFGDRLYMELNRHKAMEERQIEHGLIGLAVDANIPIVATNQAYFATSDMYEAHDALVCVAEGRYVSEEDRPRLNPEYRFKSAQEMALLFRDLPEALENTLHFAKRCHVFSPSRAPILPGFAMRDDDGEVLTESDALRMQARTGLEARLEKHVFKEGMSEEEKQARSTPYFERLEYELDVIITMKFPGYFLIVSDFIIWAKQHHIPVGPGRGSGAGSVVAWALLITDLDPLRFGLIFERFLNPERVSMPDFDIDFCQDRRDEVIRYVQEKYGHDKVAQIITFGKLQARAVLRDVGRVLQMPYSQVDRICKLVPNNPANPVTLGQAIEMEPLLKQQMDDDESVAKLVALSLKLEGLYRHASTHAAGVVIADRPLQELVPIYRDPKSDMPVVQYSMKYAEAAGLVKFDFLGLKTLSVLQQCVDMLKPRGIDVDLSALDFTDETTYRLLTKGNTLGVFQFESAGMQDALRKLKPDSLEDLIALGALYRPGPMDNIPTYIARKHGREKVDTLHPMLKEVLAETYGVIIYQEQVQKIAQVMSGYTLGGADLLRRAMGKKIKAEMDAQRVMFVDGAVKNNVSEEQASNIFDLVAKFAGYGFNKSHAAAYAVIAYQTAYLKANYPVEFIAASMNYEMNSTDKLAQFKQEAAHLGITLLPPDINHSQVIFSVEPYEGTLAVRYALSAIKNVGAQAMAVIVAERKANGPFQTIQEFMQRVDASALNRRQVEHLIHAGCFDSINPNRRQLLESLDMLLHIANSATQARASSQVSLFGDEEAQVGMPSALKPTADYSAMERLKHEYAAIGFYLSAHPLDDYKEALEAMRIKPVAGLAGRLTPKYTHVTLAGVVMGSKVKVSPRGKFAFIQLSDISESYEVSVFDETLLATSHEQLQEGELLIIECEGKADDGGARLIAKRFTRLQEKLNDARFRHMSCHIHRADDIATIKQAIGNAAQSGTEIELNAHIREGSVRIRLKSRYHINAHILRNLREAGIEAQAA
jgi:DNA polymerase-3 subunit alpha